jgi:TPR repeat protein
VAQYIYANLLIEGDGIDADEDMGISWLRSSARGGYARAVDMRAENNISLEAE